MAACLSWVNRAVLAVGRHFRSTPAVSTDRPRWSGSCQFGRLVSEPHSFIETNKREKTNKQNPDREDVSKRYFHTRFACMQIGSRSSWGCRQDCR